jgi:predicted nuclease of restriction endonuclease-like (RecB) superfamily
MSKRQVSLKLTASTQTLLDDLRELITVARQDVARTVNSALVMLYWNVGRRIRQDILKGKRAGYGEQIVHALSAKLVTEFGGGFGQRNLFNMVRFAEVFEEESEVSLLSRDLSWTHLRSIIYLDDPLKREFYAESFAHKVAFVTPTVRVENSYQQLADFMGKAYAEMCRVERWSTRTLEKKIAGLLYERTALSKRPDALFKHKLRALREEDRLTPDLIITGSCGGWRRSN